MDLISVEITAEILHVDESTIRRLIQKHYIPSFRLGPKLIRVYKIDVDALKKRVDATSSTRLSFLARKMKYPSCL